MISCHDCMSRKITKIVFELKKCDVYVHMEQSCRAVKNKSKECITQQGFAYENKLDSCTTKENVLQDLEIKRAHYHNKHLANTQKRILPSNPAQRSLQLNFTTPKRIQYSFDALRKLSSDI